MRFLVLLSAFFLSFMLSQSALLANNPVWRIGVSATANSFSEIKSIGAIQHDYVIESPGYQFGLRLQYDYNDKSSFITGLHYFDVKYSVDYDYYPIDSNDPLIPRVSDINSNYLDIPIQYCHRFALGDRLNIYPFLGASVSLLISENSKTQYENDAWKEAQFAYKRLVGVFAGMGLQYHVKNRLNVNLEIGYKQFLNGYDPYINQSPSLLFGTIGLSFALSANS